MTQQRGCRELIESLLQSCIRLDVMSADVVTRDALTGPLTTTLLRAALEPLLRATAPSHKAITSRSITVVDCG